MHKFFCNYNNLTERYELSVNKGNFFNPKINVQAENTLLPEIKNDLQFVYEVLVLIKEVLKDEKMLTLMDETELMLSNLYYSFFASPLELVGSKLIDRDLKKLVILALERMSKLEKEINIPEHNRASRLIKNNFQTLFNTLP